jgi:hypothetical protein
MKNLRFQFWDIYIRTVSVPVPHMNVIRNSVLLLKLDPARIRFILTLTGFTSLRTDPAPIQFISTLSGTDDPLNSSSSHFFSKTWISVLVPHINRTESPVCSPFLKNRFWFRFRFWKSDRFMIHFLLTGTVDFGQCGYPRNTTPDLNSDRPGFLHYVST